MPDFEASTDLPVPAERAFEWHTRPGAFERLVPPWWHVRLIERHGDIHDGDRMVMALRLGRIEKRWLALHDGYVENRKFTDVQLDGPFAEWRHTHSLQSLDQGHSRLTDHVTYRPPAGFLGEALGAPLLKQELTRMFAFRHERTREDLRRHEAFVGVDPWRIAMTGASGLIGAQLSAFLRSGGHEVLPMVRRSPREHEIHWDPARQEVELEPLEGLDAVVHLAGESIASGRWTPERKAAILDSRVSGTRLLATALAKLKKPPRVLVCASAIGYYGDRSDEILTEDSPPGTGFLADVCQAWEAAAEPARQAGIRVVHVRTGIVLSAQGGALAQMLLPFRLGLGGVIGSGRQYMSWIGFDDLIGAFHHALFTESMHGALNATAPHPVTNAEFVRVLGKVLGRPTVIPLPAQAVRLLLGELGEALLLEGARVLPTKLEASEFVFAHPELEGALRSELGR